LWLFQHYDEEKEICGIREIWLLFWESIGKMGVIVRGKLMK